MSSDVFRFAAVVRPDEFPDEVARLAKALLPHEMRLLREICDKAPHTFRAEDGFDHTARADQNNRAFESLKDYLIVGVVTRDWLMRRAVLAMPLPLGRAVARHQRTDKERDQQ